MNENPILGESHVGPDGVDVHNPCGTPLLVMTVYHSIHFTEFGNLGVGSGEVRTEKVPYCPTCGPVPNEIGEPIMKGLFD